MIYFLCVWVLVIIKVEMFEEMWFCVGIVNVLINEEIVLYIKICVEVGILEEEFFVVEECLENFVYICYVLDVGYFGDFLDLMVVFVFCVMGYGEIGVWLIKDYVFEYVEWIGIYGVDDY